MTTAETTFHRRPLPSDLVAFDSEEGRQLLVEALAAGTAGAFFPLISHLHTQADPAWCGLGSLVTTLNALGIDPGRTWKGPWRHLSEELLICCKTSSRPPRRGCR
jgi:glutathione gamma-glutamylcysteinyltransferase